MGTEQIRGARTDASNTLELIRERLEERAFLFEDNGAYRGGVEDALREVERSPLVDGDGTA